MEYSIMIMMVFTFTITGLPLGYILGKICKEELLAGKKYFTIMQNSILLLMVLTFAYFSSSNTPAIVILTLFIFIHLAEYITSYVKYYGLLMYAVFAGFIMINLSNQISLAIICSLIFIYGIPTGSLMASDREKFFEFKKKEDINNKSIKKKQIKKRVKR